MVVRKTPGLEGLLLAVFFSLLIITALATYRDYGETYDTWLHLDYGKLMLEFLKTGDRAFEQFHDLSYYGPLADTAAEFALNVLSPSTHTEAVEQRHLINFLISLIGLIAIYHTLKMVYGWKAGFAGMLIFLFLPSIYGHSFNNPKDVIFGSMYMASLWGVMFYLQDKTLPKALLAGFLTGIAIDQRIGGVFLIAVFFSALAYSLSDDAKREGIKAVLMRALYGAIVFLIAASAAVYTFHPFLWPDPFDRLATIYRIMSDFPGTIGNNQTLFMGRFYDIRHLPWYYIPVWVNITVPLLTLLFIYCAVILGTVRFFKNNLTRNERHLVIISAAAVLFPVIAIIIKDSVLYDGIRHLIFIFYPLVLLSVFGLASLFRILPLTGLRYGLIVSMIIYYIFIGREMVLLHPYQSLYFNEVAGGLKGAAERFETDYWGSSYKEGIAWLNKNTIGEVKVAAGSHFSMDHYFRPGITLVRRNPDFYISTTRYNEHERVKTAPVHTVAVEGVDILYIKPVSEEAFLKLRVEAH
ncbi:MAG: glycosyltransferase family 39 protein [Deltaproteobacteria bacterium]|nr:glycosyltransferase family 39 protein [Deltaproteobacteria bacterium]